MNTEDREREMYRLKTISHLVSKLLREFPTARMIEVMERYPNMPRERVARKVAEEMLRWRVALIAWEQEITDMETTKSDVKAGLEQWEVVDGRTGCTTGKKYGSRLAAGRVADRLDLEYGAVRYGVRRVEVVMGRTQLLAVLPRLTNMAGDLGRGGIIDRIEAVYCALERSGGGTVDAAVAELREYVGVDMWRRATTV